MIASPASPNSWTLALVILALQLLLSAGLFFANRIAESVAGRQVSEVLLLGDGAPHFALLPLEICCAGGDAHVRATLNAQDAALADPAILITSAHDNALLTIGGVRIAGLGLAEDGVSIQSRRPLLLRIPKSMAAPGADLDITVQRAIGFGHLRPFYIGEYDALYRSYLALRILRSDLPLATAVIAVFVAAFSFCAAPLFGDARGLLLSLAGLAAGWAGQHLGLFLSDPPWGAVANAGVYIVSFWATLLCLVWFFVEWTSALAQPSQATRTRLRTFLIGPWPDRIRSRFPLLVTLSVIAAALIAAFALQRGPAIALQHLDRAVGLFGIPVMAFCFLRVGVFYARTGLRYPLEAASFLFVILAGLADIAMVRFFKTYGIFTGPAVLFFPLALMLSLAARARGVFEAAAANAERLNTLVAAREQDIRASLDELQRRERADMLVEERSRIMRDMHDGIGGHLLGLILQARAKRLSDEALLAGLEDGLNDLRLVVDSLEQGEGSLSTALGAFRARIEPRCTATGVALDWRIEDVGPTPQIGPDKTLQIFRILQEACTNALKHGAPQRIEIGLSRAGAGRVTLWLSDDGRGFAAETAQPGRGLANMRRRAQEIGARLALASAPGRTRVTLDLDAPS